jgi:hypothetical protein
MVMVSFQYSRLFDDYALAGVCSLISLIIIVSFLTSLLGYRKRETHISMSQAVMFYLKMKCFKTKATLDNYIE